jgi:hypothetical protein
MVGRLQVSPDYVWEFDVQPDGAIAFDRTLQALAGTTAVDVQLVLQRSAGGQVAFDRLSLAAVPAPAARKRTRRRRNTVAFEVRRVGPLRIPPLGILIAAAP